MLKNWMHMKNVKAILLSMASALSVRKYDRSRCFGITVTWIGRKYSFATFRQI